MKEDIPYCQWVYTRENPKGTIVELSSDESDRADEMKKIASDGGFFTPLELEESINPTAVVEKPKPKKGKGKK